MHIGVPGGSHLRCVYVQDLCQGEAAPDNRSPCQECISGTYQEAATAVVYTCKTCRAGSSRQSVTVPRMHIRYVPGGNYSQGVLEAWKGSGSSRQSVTMPRMCVRYVPGGNYSQSVLMQNLWKGSGSSRQSVTMPRMCVRYGRRQPPPLCIRADLCTRRGCADNRSPCQECISGTYQEAATPLCIHARLVERARQR